LARTLDSVIDQTHQDFEVVLIDDGSTDGTKTLVASKYGHDSRIKYFYQDNQGVAVARNHGFRRCQGEYVAMLDSDDTWSPWKLELQIACLEHRPEVGMVWTDMVAIGPDGTIVSNNYLRTMYEAYRWFATEQLFSHSYPLDRVAHGLSHVVGGGTFYTGDIFSQMVMGNLVHTPTVLIKRERLDKIRGCNEALSVSGEDYDFHLRNCKAGPVGFIDLATIRYQTGMPDRLTRDSCKLDIAKNCLRTILPVLAKDRARIRLSVGMIRSRLAEVHDWIGDAALQMGQTVEARRHLLASLGHRPLQPRTLWLLGVSTLPFGIGLSARKLLRSLRSKFHRVASQRRRPSHRVEELRLNRSAG
jgi:glycosyltransferase involved in cell wall biosynthesis